MFQTNSTGPGRAVRLLSVSVVVIAGVLTGCTAPDEQQPPADRSPQRPAAPQTPPAEPEEGPEVTAPPRGQVIDLPGGSPEGTVLDPSTGTLAIALREPERLALVDTETNRVRTIPALGAARHLALARPGELLVSGETADTLSTVRLPSGRMTSEVKVGRGPHDAARVEQKVFVANEFGGNVGVVRDGRMANKIGGFAQPGGLTATDGRVAVVDVGTNMLHVIDAATERRVAVLPAGKGPSHVRPTGNGRVAVADTRGNAVLSYQVTGTPRQLGRMPVAGRAYGLDTDPRRGFVYATAGNTNTVVRLRVDDDGGLSEAGQLGTVRQPNDVAVDPRNGRVYVIGKANAEVQILPPDAF